MLILSVIMIFVSGMLLDELVLRTCWRRCGTLKIRKKEEKDVYRIEFDIPLEELEDYKEMRLVIDSDSSL